MVDSLRRSYNDARKLIESDRILSSPFHDGVLFFTGAQVEIMRNLMAYANVRETFVDEYETGYYLVPDDNDWDDIRAIVADLEDTLMGNPNTLFGYDERLAEEKNKIGSLPGDNDLSPPTVPAGELWVVTSMCLFDATSATSAQMVFLQCGSKLIYVDHLAPVPGGVPRVLRGKWYLKAGDYVVFRFYGVTSGDNLFTSIHGYKMAVP